MTETKLCAHCGGSFSRKPWQKPNVFEKARHCSISCGRKAGKQRPRPACPKCGGWKASNAKVCRGCRFPSELERFEAKVQRTATCWLWTAHTLPTGYGQFRSNGRADLAHRVSYRLRHGHEAPAGYHLDHLCRVPACVNPDHLEVVTPGENSRRGLIGVLKTHCANGHPWVEVAPE